LNKTATAILAASLETVDRVGPCTAKVTLQKLEDIRSAKRRKVVSRAISILKGWEEDISPGTDEITDAVISKASVSKPSRRSIGKYGPDKLPAGPTLSEEEEIIIVEGRADIVNLMKSGINNTVAVEGTHISKSIADLTSDKGKTVIAFLDGDRGGDLILRELMQMARVDYIARAPEGKEVEHLSRREITKALQTRISAEQALELVSDKKVGVKKRKTPRHTKKEPRKSPKEDTMPSRPSRERPTKRPMPEIDEIYLTKVNELKESFKAVLFDADKKVIVECGVAEITKTLEEQESVDAIVFDGVVTQRLVDTAEKKKTSLLIGAAIADIENRPRGMHIFTFDDIE